MLVDPNLESPANVDAAKLFRDNRKQFDSKLRFLARKSIGDVWWACDLNSELSYNLNT